MISAALFFASTAISSTMEKMLLEQMRSRVGEADLVIIQGEQETTPFFRALTLDEFREDINYAVGMIETQAIFRPTRTESVPWSMRGIEMDDLQSMTPVSYVQEANLFPFQGRKVIIGENVAEQYGLVAGDSLELVVEGTVSRFRIAAIAQSTGPFRDDGQNPLVIVPRETLRSLYNMRGSVTGQYISLNNPALTTELVEEISTSYPRYRVQEALPQAEVATMIRSITIPFLFMTMVVLAVSAFIIYTSFKLIAKERLPVIGTFRSIGATKKMTGRVMLAESLVYGLLGGALGSVLGVGVLSVMSGMVMSSTMQSSQSMIHFTPIHLLLAFLVALFVSLASSALPIKRAAGIPLKDIILDTGGQGVKAKRSRGYIYACVFILTALLLPRILPREMGALSSAVGMFLSIIAIILSVPYLTAGFVRIFEKIYAYIFGNEGIMAIRNLRQNSSILNSISLLALGTASLLVVNTVSFSVVKEITNIFTRNVNHEVTLRGNQLDNRIISRAAVVDGVEDVYGIYSHYGVNLVDRNGTINYHVPTSPKYFEHMANLGVTGNYDEVLAELNEGRNIMVTTILQDIYGLKLGDMLTIDMKSGPRDYQVVGFMDTMMEIGNFALIGQRYHKLDMEPQSFQMISIKIAGTQQEVADRLKETFKGQQIEVFTVDEWGERNISSNVEFFDILRGFSILTLVIGIFGVLNNLFISFIERKRSLAMLRSVGMSQRQIIKMIFIESLSGGMIGGIIGVLGAVLMLSVMPYLLLAIGAPIPISFSAGLLLLSLLAGVVIMIIASVSPALKSSKLNIVDALKYE
jgi:putative ABC transport system permease protein